MERAKGVHPAGLQPAVDLGPLFGQEAAVPDIGLGPREVDLAVRGVEVADREHRAAAAHLLYPLEDRPVEV